MDSSNRSLAQKVATGLLWLLTILVAGSMLAAGGTKFSPSGMWPDLFTGWGYPLWFLWVVGTLEVGGALLLLIPRFASYAGMVLATVMLGALYTLLTNAGDMGVTTPGMQFLFISVIVASRWNVRWTSGRSAGSPAA